MTDLQKLVNAAPWDGDLKSCAMCAEAAATWWVGGEGWCADCLTRAAINALAGELARADKAEALLAEAHAAGLKEAGEIAKRYSATCAHEIFARANILARIKENGHG